MMKNVLAAVLVVVGFVGSCAQDLSQKEVPSVVLNAFMTAYPQAADVEWELRGGIYNVAFEVGKTDHEAWYDAAGKLLKHKEEVPLHTLPTPVAETLKKDFAAYKIDDADKVEENGKTIYHIELDGSPNDRVLQISPEGRVLDNRIDY